MAHTTAGVEEFVNVVSSYARDTEGVKVYRGYSGRGMYGRRCIGLTARDESDIDHVLREVTRWDENGEFEDFLASKSRDSLGLGVIVYFPAANDNAEPEDDD